jgi:predicted nucleic acid-binding protein
MMLGDRVFVDTCMIIEYLKGKLELNKQECYINSIVLMELYLGARNKQELYKLKAKLQGFRLLDITQDEMDLATQIVDMYALSHGAKIQDAIIASSCLISNLSLATYNLKDFRYIPDLKLIKDIG